VVASAAESELGACFKNAPSGTPIRITLIKLGHQQPATKLRTDNSTAFGILNETIKQKISKAMDMIYHWLADRVRQKQFDVYWHPGRENLRDYHTTHHSAQHHKDTHGLILHQASRLQVLRGCDTVLPLPLLQPHPQPQPQMHRYAQTCQSTQRATKLRGVQGRAYAVTVQNLNTVSTMTAPLTYGRTKESLLFE
jgi:hypothetical protein